MSLMKRFFPEIVAVLIGLYVLLAVVMWVFPNHGQASEFDAGKADAKGLLNQLSPGGLGQLSGVQDVQAQSASQAELDQVSGLRSQGAGIEDVARERLHESEAGSDLQAASGIRPQFSFDVENDPIFINAARIEENAESIAGLVQSEYSDCRMETVVLAPGAMEEATCMEWPVPTEGVCERRYHVTCETVVKAANLKLISQSHADFPWSMNSQTGQLQIGRNADNYWSGGNNATRAARVYDRSVVFELNDLDSLAQFNMVYLAYDDFMQVRINGRIIYNSRNGDVLDIGTYECTGLGEYSDQTVVYHYVQTHSNMFVRRCSPLQGNGFVVGDPGNTRINLSVDIKPFLVEGENRIDVRTIVVDSGEAWLRFTALQNTTECSGEWLRSGQCGHLQAQTEAGYCAPVAGEQCVEGPETRMIQGVPVHQACWRYQTRYECMTGETTDDNGQCSELRAAGCSQIGSECTEFLPNGECLSREQRFSCPVGEPVTQEVMQCGGSAAFCVDGSCADTDYEASTDFAKAASWLTLMDEMGDDLDPDNLSVFNGQALRCNDKKVFNCCKNPRLLRSIDMDDFCTSQDEPILAERRKAGQCHKVGRRCGDRVLGVCMRQVESWCCFSGKLGRILQEQGRQQLGISWGTASSPNCRGFTQDELERLDWSLLDLSEFFADAMDKINLQSGESMTNQLQQRVQGLLP